MKHINACLFLCLPFVFSAYNGKKNNNDGPNVDNLPSENITNLYDPVTRQLWDFQAEHPIPIGLWTKSSGEPTEIRDIHSINSDQFNNQLLVESMLHFDAEKTPERVVHAKGTGAFGYFEVTHDVSKYTYADVFNGIGKKTPVVARFSTSVQNLGGSELTREFKGLGVKFYTRQGNLDLTCISSPVYLYREPHFFASMVHAFKQNPQTNMYDQTMIWDAVTLRPIQLHCLLWQLADFGIPDGYRKMDAFPIHAFELANQKGETHYVRFNFRTEQGIATLTTEQAAAIQGQDLDYYTRDLYNNIENKNFPSWRLEMDVLTKHDLKNLDYDPFDVTRLWKNGTYFTVQIGRLVLNKNVDNHFRDIEQGAFNPANLVPGIPGPVDWLFRGRRAFYKDTQNYRLGRNHNKILINKPLYENTYNRNGRPPTNLNGGDSPNYYPNSFNGPIPYVDEKRPNVKLLTLESNAVDLEPIWYFYNYVIDNEAHRERYINNVALSLSSVTPPVLQRALKLLYLIDADMGMRIRAALEVVRIQQAAQRAAAAATPKPLLANIKTAQPAKIHEEH